MWLLTGRKLYIPQVASPLARADGVTRREYGVNDQFFILDEHDHTSLPRRWFVTKTYSFSGNGHKCCWGGWVVSSHLLSAFLGEAYKNYV